MTTAAAGLATALLRCPFCHTALDERGRCHVLACGTCERTYPVEDGIPDMLHPDLPGAREKLAEIAGWPEKAKAEGGTSPTTLSTRCFRFRPGRSRAGRTSPGLRPATRSRCCSTGTSSTSGVCASSRSGPRSAGQRRTGATATASTSPPTSSSTRRSASAAARSTATSVASRRTPRPAVPGRRVRRRVLLAALHHALDLPRMVSEMARVTRLGGVVAGLDEGIRGFFRDPTNPDQARERSSGSTSTSTRSAYAAAFRRAGLRVRRHRARRGLASGSRGGSSRASPRSASRPAPSSTSRLPPMPALHKYLN